MPLAQAPGAPTASSPATPATADLHTGSRRRRLWDLPSHAHCPVMGCCLPMPALRRLVHKVTGQASSLDDYELHCTAVNEGKRRGPLAEALSKELDRRFVLHIRQAAQAKTEPALADWWQAQSDGPALAAALWAALTHPRCTPQLEDRILAQVHMLQHQVGMANRAELQRFEQLIDENAVLTRQLAQVQQRSMRQAADFARRADELDVQLLRTRGQLLAAQTELAQVQDRLSQLQACRPDLPARLTLEQENRQLSLRLLDAQRQRLQASEEAERQRQRAEAVEALLADQWQHAAREQAATQARHDAHQGAQQGARPGAGHDTAPDRAWWARQAVLCVGGRSAAVPLYRHVVERGGGRFLHHDGGEEDHILKLDSTLAAADMVICQTGCISHDAYWRVKDHCKRTGKRCLFVDSPSRTALERALAAGGQPALDNGTDVTRTPATGHTQTP